MRIRRVVVIELLRIAAVLILFMPALPAFAAEAEAKPPKALLRIRASYYGGAHGVAYWDNDFFVARDRAVTAVYTKYDTNSTIPLGWVTSRAAISADADSFQALVRSLTENHVSRKQGRCVISSTVFPLIGSLDVTWYDIGSTRRAFAVEFSGTAFPACGREIVALYQAIQNFAVAVDLSPPGPWITP